MIRSREPAGAAGGSRAPPILFPSAGLTTASRMSRRMDGDTGAENRAFAKVMLDGGEQSGPARRGWVSVAVRVPETVDPVGIETLLRMADVATYNDWVYRQISPFLGERVLEVGSGIGNMTPYYADRPLLVCVDLLAESLELARQKVGARENVAFVQGDICADATVETLGHYRFDTAVMLNVLEHIPDDARALACIHRLLAPGGRLLLLVPAERYLYGSLDRALGHHRRYERRPLRGLLVRSGYTVEK